MFSFCCRNCSRRGSAKYQEKRAIWAKTQKHKRTPCLLWSDFQANSRKFVHESNVHQRFEEFTSRHFFTEHLKFKWETWCHCCRRLYRETLRRWGQKRRRRIGFTKILKSVVNVQIASWITWLQQIPIPQNPNWWKLCNVRSF